MNVVSTKFLISRITNQLRCWWSYALSLFGIVRVRHLPTFISIEPANICQLHCPECPVGMRKYTVDDTHYLSIELFEKILSDVQATTHTMQFYFQGEPLLNKHLPQMIARAHHVGIYTIVSTNAQALTQDIANALVKSGLNRIIVSIDGFSEDSYLRQVHHRSLHRLEGNRKAGAGYCGSDLIRRRIHEHYQERNSDSGI